MEQGMDTWGWEKNTGEMPTASATKVAVRFLNGSVGLGDAGEYSWSLTITKAIASWMFRSDYDKEMDNVFTRLDEGLDMSGVLIDNAYVTGGHYKGNGHDLISHWQNTNSVPTARAKQISQIERYCSRYGEKDNALQEAKKIQDYANRLVEWETKLEKEE